MRRISPSIAKLLDNSKNSVSRLRDTSYEIQDRIDNWSKYGVQNLEHGNTFPLIAMPRCVRHKSFPEDWLYPTDLT